MSKEPTSEKEIDDEIKTFRNSIVIVTFLFVICIALLAFMLTRAGDVLFIAAAIVAAVTAGWLAHEFTGLLSLLSKRSNSK